MLVRKKGYVKIHRKMRDSDTWNAMKPPGRSLMITVLMRATHRPVDVEFGGEKRTLLPGQFTYGRAELAEDANISVQQLRTLLGSLSKIWKFLTTESTSRGSIITITNWASYQSPPGDINQEDNQPSTNDQPTDNQPPTTNKNIEEHKALGEQPQPPRAGEASSNELPTQPPEPTPDQEQPPEPTVIGDPGPATAFSGGTPSQTTSGPEKGLGGGNGTKKKPAGKEAEIKAAAKRVRDAYCERVFALDPWQTDRSKGRALTNIASWLREGPHDEAAMMLAIENRRREWQVERSQPQFVGNFFGRQGDESPFMAFASPNWQPPKGSSGAPREKSLAEQGADGGLGGYG